MGARGQMITAAEQLQPALREALASPMPTVIQVPLETKLEDWPDERFWPELKSRFPRELADAIVTGPAGDLIVSPSSAPNSMNGAGSTDSGMPATSVTSDSATRT